MNGTILSQGSFTQPATPVDTTIAIPSGTDFINIYNYTQFVGNAGANANWLYWQRGMDTRGLYRGIGGGVATSGRTASGAFVIHNPNEQNYQSVSAARAITNINGTTGVVLTGTTTGLAVGSVIRLSNLSVAAAQMLGGIDFRVTAINPGVSFTIVIPTLAAAPTIGACTGFYRIAGNPLFVPRHRVISNVSSAGSAVVTTTTAHGFAIGQEVRFQVPEISATEYGITQLDGLSGTITEIGSATAFTVDIDTSNFSAFAYPTAASISGSYTPAIVVPYGDDTPTALAQTPQLSSLEGSVLNEGFIGMTLATGELLPAGVGLDTIYWQAGKSSFGGL